MERISPKGEILSIYRKRHLVPYGEFTPGAWCPVIRFLVKRQAGYLPDLRRGSNPGVFFFKKIPLAIFICYEDIFSEEVAAVIAKGRFVLVTLTNDSWLGTLGSAQHFAFASLRAAEAGSYLIRAANTGITAYLDKRGRIVKRLPPACRGILLGNVNLVSEKTFYQRFPLLTPSFSIVFLITISLFHRKMHNEE